MNMKNILLILTLVLATTVLAEIPDTVIPEDIARDLAIKRYNELFHDKYHLNPIDNKYYLFPELPPSYFHKAELREGNWYLEGDPPAGYFIYATVTGDGRHIELTRVGFAPQ